MPARVRAQPVSLSPRNTRARPSRLCPVAHLYQEAGGTEPSHPPAPGRWVQGSLKTSEAGSQACAPQGSLGAAWCSHPRAELSQTEPPQGPPGDGVGPGGRKGSKEPVASTQG